jgi:hypothetical protein
MPTKKRGKRKLAVFIRVTKNKNAQAQGEARGAE